tara:strand:- start:805 stop:930 length:126 start_codon:yes stop_codon:yes gene_type:complete
MEEIIMDKGEDNTNETGGGSVVYEWGSYEDVSPLRKEEETS